MSDRPERFSVAELCAKRQISPAQLADKAALEVSRVQAILDGRWLPSPQERQRIAAVLAAAVSDIVWGHRATVEHLYGHGPQFGRTP